MAFQGLRPGYEVMAMIRKGQVYNTGARDRQVQTTFVACLFAIAA